MLVGKGLLTQIQRQALALFAALPDQERFYLAGRKDPGFDLYWFAVALNKAAAFPDELERWPVKMLVDLSPARLKQTFLDWALDLMAKIAQEEGPAQARQG